jgi:hypothetical protein
LNLSDAGVLAVLVLTGVVPVAAVVVVALLRGYTINVSMRRPPRTSRERSRGGRRLGGRQG